MLKQISLLKEKINLKIFKISVSISTFISVFFTGLEDVVFANDTTFDFLKEGKGKDNGAFDKITKVVQETGYSAYKLMIVIGALGVVFSLVLLGIDFLLYKNDSSKKSQNKSAAFYIGIGGMIIFSALGLAGLIKSLAEPLAQ